MLRNFDTELDQAGVTRMTKPAVSVSPTESVIAPVEYVRCLPRVAEQSYLLRDPARWSWSDLRDYVVYEIESRFGPWRRDTQREYGIFGPKGGYSARWGQQAYPIARYAFEVEAGFWQGQPIGLGRFTRASDPYFAKVIADRLGNAR